jgi:non-heme chloroperoxidase
MPMLKLTDGTSLYYKDWGPRSAQPIVFSHGWPLSADDWDNQLLFFRSKGYRVIAHDRRGHGRSSQPDFGNDMDTYVADLAELTDHLELKDAIHVGHSTGGGEAARYVARAKPGRVSKAVLISAIPPVMVKKDSNPNGTPVEVFDGFRAALAANRSEFYIAVASGPFYNFNRPGVKTRDALIRNWWRQGMMGGANAGYDCIRVFSETDFTEDLKSIQCPVLVMHSKDDQVVPYVAAGPLAAKLLPNGTLKTYADEMPHGMMTTHPDIINEDILAFIEGRELPSEQATRIAEPAAA